MGEYRRAAFSFASGDYAGPVKVLNHDARYKEVVMPNGNTIVVSPSELFDEVDESEWRSAQEVCTPGRCRAVSLVGDLGRKRKRRILKTRSKATEPAHADSSLPPNIRDAITSAIAIMDTKGRTGECLSSVLLWKKDWAAIRGLLVGVLEGLKKGSEVTK